jgi:tetratricopeptide (TPR) repeat protein
MSRVDKILEMMQSGGKDAFLQHALALEYIKLGQLEPALEQFLDLLSANPDYVGSYYHLGKLYESLGDANNALNAYEKGMEVAKKLKEQHAYNELMSARDELL